MAPERTPPGTSSDLDAALRSVSTGIGRLRGQLAAADSFHRVAVQQITALLDRLEAAERENERLREDAERYWWLTDDHPRQETRERVHEVSSRISVSGKGRTDAAIDAAMAAEQAHGIRSEK